MACSHYGVPRSTRVLFLYLVPAALDRNMLSVQLGQVRFALGRATDKVGGTYAGVCLRGMPLELKLRRLQCRVRLWRGAALRHERRVTG